MEFTPLMVFVVVLMGTVSSGPTCKSPCSPVSNYHLPHFQHVLDLQHSSVAPWNLTINATVDREPQIIQHAVCRNCVVKDMVAKPIFIRINVYNRLRHNHDFSWCQCPYDLAVGCTCVNEQRS